MKIFILKKSISDLKKPIVRNEYDTEAMTVGDFIAEMVKKNYAARPAKFSLDDCISTATSEFEDGSYYIVNTTKNVKYALLEQAADFSDGDEIVLIKLKYVRGIIWDL
ncbi:MAG: hypothetical protein OSJ83_02975 [Clostridia bacterium]|nr:hypothetical protein [Clostridia bacterium]